MMRNRKTIKALLASLLLLQGGLSASAQQFASKLLAEMAGKLPELHLQDSYSPGIHDCGAYKGKPLILEADANGRVAHLGYKLFVPDVKTLYPSDVYNFLERYFLELSLEPNLDEFEQKLKMDKVRFLEGSFYDLRKLTPETPFSIDRIEDKGYNVTWSVDDRPIVSVLFPIQFELLLGMPKVEIEQCMRQLIEASRQATLPAPVPLAGTEAMSDGILRSKPTSFYELESLTTATYYQTSADGSLQPIFSSEHKDYSAANLFLGRLGRNCNYRLYVEQNLYGGEKQTYTIPFTDWLTYCAANKFVVYFAVEEEREDGLKVLVLARNADLGYNHLLSVILPDNFVEKPDAVLKAKFNAFIPTQNVKSLYGKYKTRPRIKI